MKLRDLVLIMTFITAPSVARGWDGIEFGGDAAFDLIHASTTHSWLANVDAGAWLEADLGTLSGADDWYLFVNPTLVWGAEEEWKWNPRLYQIWLKWDGSERFSALAGITDLSWHFHSLPSASPFVRLPARNSGEFSPGSIGLLDLYPLSSPTILAEFKPSTLTYIRAAASWLESDHQVRGRELFGNLESANRSILIAEAGYSDEGDEDSGWKHLTAGLGGWWLPGAEDSWGLYAIVDAKLWSESDEAWQGLSGFASISTAQSFGYEQESRLVAGITYEGLLPNRDEDTTALAVIVEQPSRQACELLHRIPLSDHLWIQASLQWQSQVEDSTSGEWRAGVRFGVQF